MMVVQKTNISLKIKIMILCTYLLQNVISVFVKARDEMVKREYL